MEKNFVSLSAYSFIRKTLIFSAFVVFAFSGIVRCRFAKEKKSTEHNSGLHTDGRNAWGTVGYGGGGAMFYPEVSPFDPDYAFVSSDMTGSFVTYNGGASWRMFNLHSPVDFYVFDPLDSNTVYAKSLALFKSKDRGVTWNLLYPSPSETKGLVSKGDHAQEIVVTLDSTIREVLALAVDPENSKKLYAVIGR